MKKIVYSFLLLLLSLSAIANEPVTNLIVWAKDGTKVAYALCEKPKVTFTETDLVITAKGVEVNYALENIARFTYEVDEATSIKGAGNEGPLFICNGESLLFPSLPFNATIAIYTFDGLLVLKETVKTTGEHVLPLNSLHNGVYLVNVNGFTTKIVKI